MNIIMSLNEISKDIREIIRQKQEEHGITFEEENHIYTMMGKTDYPSVSKVMKKFYKEFPTEEASYNKAKGDVEKQKQLIKEWNDAGTYSTNIGSRVHYYLEKELVSSYGNYKEVRQPIFECDLVQTMKSDSMISAGKKYLKLMKERGCELVDTEMVLGDPELGYTGQPDKLWLLNGKDNKSVGLLITDWKTNQPKNFKETNWTGRMYPPFHDYPNNALGHYYIQLPLYGRLILKMLKGSKYENLKLFGCIISHLTDDGTFKEYKVPKNIIETILDMKLDFIK